MSINSELIAFQSHATAWEQRVEFHGCPSIFSLKLPHLLCHLLVSLPYVMWDLMFKNHLVTSMRQLLIYFIFLFFFVKIIKMVGELC